MSEKRNLALTLAEARELYRKDAYTEALLLTAFTKEELEGKDEIPTWVALLLAGIDGYFVSDDSIIKPVVVESNHINYDSGNKNIFATQSQAKSSLAMAQLSQLMKALGNECKVAWDSNSTKFVICRFNNSLHTSASANEYFFLAFKTEKVRDAFLEKHRNLIKQYFEL